MTYQLLKEQNMGEKTPLVVAWIGLILITLGYLYL